MRVKQHKGRKRCKGVGNMHVRLSVRFFRLCRLLHVLWPGFASPLFRRLRRGCCCSAPASLARERVPHDPNVVARQREREERELEGGTTNERTRRVTSTVCADASPPPPTRAG